MPILIRDGSYVYIVPERTIPGHWIDDSDGSNSSCTSTMDLEEALHDPSLSGLVRHGRGAEFGSRSGRWPRHQMLHNRQDTND
jgi:hypothetical protein